MANIKQYQRRAIESLLQSLLLSEQFKIRWPKDIDQDKCRFFYHNQEVYFLGISTGVGTCSDIHDLNVAVFGNFGEKPEPRCPARQGLSDCDFAVLVRKPTLNDPEEWNNPKFPQLVIELLFVPEWSSKNTNFKKLVSYNNMKTIYSHLA